MLTGVGQPSPLVSAIISAMITPAILILATGNLIGTAITLHSRIIDRGRYLLQRHSELRDKDPKLAGFINDALQNLRKRLRLLSLSISSYYLAVGFFVASSLVIAVTLALSLPHWIPAALTITGALLLLLGSLATFWELYLSNRAFEREMDSGFF